MIYMMTLRLHHKFDLPVTDDDPRHVSHSLLTDLHRELIDVEASVDFCTSPTKLLLVKIESAAFSGAISFADLVGALCVDNDSRLRHFRRQCEWKPLGWLLRYVRIKMMTSAEPLLIDEDPN